MTADMQPNYDEGVEYAVKLRREIRYLGAPLLPLPVHYMGGRALNNIVVQEGPDVIDRADPR